MKTIITTTIAMTMAVAAVGRAQDTLPSHDQGAGGLWSMERCMAYAAEHASAVVQARWDVASATATRNEAFADFFPSVSAQVGTQFSWGRNIDPETNTYNDVTTFNNGYGIYASLMLFDGGQTLNRYRQARNERERYLNAVEMKRDDSAIAAMMAYADAVYYLNSIKIAEDKLGQSEGMLRLTKVQEELGVKGKPDVVQAEATVANDRYLLVHNRNLYDQAMLKLRSAMNMPATEVFAIDTIGQVLPGRLHHGTALQQGEILQQGAALQQGEILQQGAAMQQGEAMQMTGLEDAESVYEMALLCNPKALDAKMTVKTRKYAYDIAKGHMLPTISLNAGISTSYYKTLSGGYTAPAFGEQFRNNRGEYVSATLSIPLFSNLSRISGKNRAKYAYEQAKEQLDEEKRRLHDEILSAVMDRDGYAVEIESLRAKTEADGEAYRLNGRKYEEGLLSLIDLQLSANTYFSSRVELLQKEMLYILKSKLVEYYKGNRLWM